MQPEQLSDIIYIRNEGHSVVEAINRQLAHYAYHVGQIVFYAKLLKKTEWESLSIPRNKSGDYNSEKFSKEKSIQNFTEEELEHNVIFDNFAFLSSLLEEKGLSDKDVFLQK